MHRVLVAAALTVLTLLTYFKFPGHAYLQQDTQIYVPILENLWDGSVLRKDILVQSPHVAFTLYDETAVALRKLTGMGFEGVLTLEQLIFRGLGFWGVYLIATALGLSPPLALFATAIWSLGATIVGPAVLTVEYEPVPRGFAVPLLFLALGLMARRRYMGAGVAAAAAFLMHPPTIYPFWALYGAWALRPGRRFLKAFIPLISAVAILFVAARFQTGVTETQEFFARITPGVEALQRMRASYNWISMWWRSLLPHYLFLFAAAMLACWRLRRFITGEMRLFLIGLPAIGMLSMPLSWLLLERMKWALIPQFQPMRALLFVTALAVLLGAVAGCVAARERRSIEAVAWFALVYWVPANGRVPIIGAMTALACIAVWTSNRWAVAAVAIGAFFMYPLSVKPIPRLGSPSLTQLSQWARTSTPKDAVFLFADLAKNGQPGMFRAEALRAVYVDWKGGGQVNYLPELGEQWWSRWQSAMSAPFNGDVSRYRDLGIDYLIVSPKDKLAGKVPVYRNPGFLVYRPI
ncbi:MAG: hypothetical protein M3Y07_03075 [Acidobacteriota bacterium]|nr:hypothetical protein [Acidobacteriota bacterium]